MCAEMGMIVLTADFDNPTFSKWHMVNVIILNNLTPKMLQLKLYKGYEGLFSCVPEHFNLTKMFRNGNGSIVYEFTSEQWIMFLLKWA